MTRAKRGLKIQRRYSRPVDKSTGLRADQTVVLTGINTSKDYPEPLRRISYYDADTDKHLVFLTNNFILPAFTNASLFKARWRVELFFKWIKQHLRINIFLRYIRECRKNSGLDCRLRICPGSHPEETAEYPAESLHNFTDFEPPPIRERTALRLAFSTKLPNIYKARGPETVAIIQSLIGQ